MSPCFASVSRGGSRRGRRWFLCYGTGSSQERFVGPFRGEDAAETWDRRWGCGSLYELMDAASAGLYGRTPKNTVAPGCDRREDEA